jgi:hypothetical protein
MERMRIQVVKISGNCARVRVTSARRVQGKAEVALVAVVRGQVPLTART